VNASVVPGSSVVLLRHRSIPPSIRAYLIIRTSTSQLFSRLRCAASVILRTCHRELQGLPQGTTFKIVLPSSSQILSHYSLPSIVVTVLYFDYIVDMLDMCARLRMYNGDIHSRFFRVPYAPGHPLLLFRGSRADACFIIQPIQRVSHVLAIVNTFLGLGGFLIKRRREVRWRTCAAHTVCVTTVKHLLHQLQMILAFFVRETSLLSKTYYGGSS